MKSSMIAIAAALALPACQTVESAPATATSTAPAAPAPSSTDFAAQAAALVAQMTLEEKVSQMFDKAPAIDRLDVPEYVYWNEALHGVARAGDATVFPQAIGIAATFDEDLMLKVATAISDEGRAKHHDYLRKDVRSIYTGLTFWSPNINIFRDPRWGRGQETYGEDPFLTGRMAINFVNGLQGDDDDYLKSVATVKHYAVHSGPEKTRHSDDYAVSAKDLNETYLPAFAMAIEEADPESLMCAYNAVRGEPACANTYLMRDVLRGDLGFDGFVVSDCGAINDVYLQEGHHGFTDTMAEGAAVSVRAGTDLECEDHNGKAFRGLTEAVRTGLIKEGEIDQAVTRLFTARYKLGMMPGQTTKWDATPISVVASDAHIALSEEAARKSLVLLKNEGILPLKPDQKIAVIGPNADNFDVLIGNYNGNPTRPMTPLAALTERLGAENVVYAPGSGLADGMFTHYTPVPASVLSHDGQPGLKASYWAAEDASGTPANTETVANIDEKWKMNPASNTIDGPLTAVWTGKITPPKTSRYRFGEGVAVMVDGGEVGADGVMLTAGRAHDLKVSFTRAPVWHNNNIAPMATLAWIDMNRDLAAEAMAAAREADVVLFFSGLSAKLEGEEMAVSLPGFDGGDRTSLDLPKPQMDLMKAIHATGKPMVQVNFTGSAVNMKWADTELPAIVQGFYPGERTGPAVTALLMGDYSPSGRLPVTFYENLDGMPAFDDYAMTNRTYKYYNGTPVYGFGHGLGFASVSYSDVTGPGSHDATKPLPLSVTLANAGDMAADDVVQVYAHGGDGDPARELVGFSHVSLAPGETRTVEIVIPAKHLTRVATDGTRMPLSGQMHYSVGAGQPGYVDADRIGSVDVTFTN
ncbi:MAG: glycoside hydrolase family 3 C-terminal domain-containing protein [Pacificimonas sp.]